ncbi:MAG: Dipeptide transport system permease protein DppC [uncultured Thermomicrobiales bacterium]|uniref:Dipeptide transport system permease protein DppC n=1 Tax=uncultured Thermomicrobiales bacterium TaxID=1645740 RepID=A0A6J4U9G4_9BACT|nr:MAG: Dipeptide transport system permease protein DppC [uncultured Thermomicrobiales bacterium]
MAVSDGVSARGASAATTAEETVRDTSPTRGTIPGGDSGGATLATADLRERRHTSTLRRFVRASPLGTVSALFLLAGIAIALLGPFLGTGDPEALSPLAMFSSPSADLPMGGDYLGRSVLARLVSGLRVSLALAAVSALMAATAGTFLGLVAGYFGGTLDELVMRLTDVLFAFPTILLGLLMAVVLEPGVRGVVLTIIIATIPVFARVARGPTLAVRATEYTTAARVVGASPARILFRYVLPNVSTPLLVQLAFTLSGALIAEGALSFLGLGVQPPRPSLGSLLRDGKTYMEIAPWTMLFPGLTLALAILAVNLLGDELQSFTDPRLRRR